MATWYGSGMWMLLGTLSAMIAATRPARRASWWLLAVVSLLASIDEYLELHERLDVPGEWLAERLPFDIGFTWVMIGAPIALLIGLLLLRLVLSLLILERNDWFVNNAYLYGTMVEELLEMAGIAIALASVISLFHHDAVSGTLRLDPAVQTAVAVP